MLKDSEMATSHIKMQPMQGGLAAVDIQVQVLVCAWDKQVHRDAAPNLAELQAMGSQAERML